MKPLRTLIAAVIVFVVLATLGVAAWVGIVLVLGLLNFHAGLAVLFCAGMATALYFAIKLVDEGD